MFARLLERVLVKFLAPYVEGLSNNALRYGIRSGVLELRDLRVKPEALSLLGVLGYSVKAGTLGSVSLHISWKSLFTGRLYIAIEELYLEAHEEAIPPADMRVMKSKTIDLRMDQIRDLITHAAALEAGASDLMQEGFLMKMNRKILNNLSVNISDVAVWLVTTTCPQALGVKLPGLKVMSTDGTSEVEHKASSRTSRGGDSSSLNKLMRLDGFCFLLSQANSSDISTASHVLSPISACIRLTHAPLEKLLQLHVDLGSGEEQNQIVLRHSQWVHFFKVLAEAADQAIKLQASLVAPAIQQALLADVEASAAEYGRLYGQELSDANNCGPPLDTTETARMQMLEDALPVRPLAQQRWIAHRSLKQRLAAPSPTKGPLSWVERISWALFTGCRDPAACSNADFLCDEYDDQDLLEEDMSGRLKNELNAVTKAEEVERPARSLLNFVFRELALKLIDDRWQSEEGKELLTLVLPTALMCIELEEVTDSQGKEFMEWSIACDFGAWHARHACRDVLMHLVDHVAKSEKSPSQISLGGQGGKEPLGEIDVEDMPIAAKLLVESKLDSDSSILKVCFESSPFEILLLPGMIGRIIEFFTIDMAAERAVQAAERAVQAATGENTEKAATDLLLEGFEMYQKVQDQIPDRLYLDLAIAGPVLRAPVEGRGDLILCPGHLKMSMPEPCRYSKLDFLIGLSDTVLSAVIHSGEHFNMIQPVPVQVRVVTEETTTNVDVVVESLALFLAPEALEMLLYLPETVNVILDENALPPQEAACRQHEGASAHRMQRVPTLQRRSSAMSSRHSERSEARSLFRSQALLLEAAPTFLQELGLEDGAIQSSPSSTSLCYKDSANRWATLKYGSDGADKEEQDLLVTTTVCCDNITLVLADMLTSMLKLQLALPSPGLVVKAQRVPQVLTVEVDHSSLELEGLNQHNGQWEPVIENFGFGLSVQQPPLGNANQSLISVDVSGRTPLLLNLTPTLFAKVNRSIEVVTEIVAAASASPGEAMRSFKSGAKFRLFNLCGHSFELQFFTSAGLADRHTTVPTGSSWQSLDRFILPCFATEACVRLPGGKVSKRLKLDLDNAVTVPGDRAILEIFTPEGGKHRILLLAPPLRLLNMTEAPLHLRFHGSDGRTLPIDLQQTMLCKAALLGGASPDDDSAPSRQESWQSPGLLPPNAIFAVPDAAVSDPEGPEDNVHCWLSVGSTHTDHSPPMKVGGGTNPRGIMHYLRDDGVEVEALGQDVYIEWRAKTHSFGRSSRCAVATVELRPPITILNAVPIGTLQIRYLQQQSSARVSDKDKWTVLPVRRFGSQSIHNISRNAAGDSVFISARLSEAAPWSPSIRFTWDQLQDEGIDAPLQMLQVHQQQPKKGAAVGMNVNPVEGSKLRFSCPYWFVNCSGIEAPLSLEVNQNKRQLPSEGGLTLLPSLCQQEPVDLVLRKEGSLAVAATLENQYMPPNWSTLGWSVGKRPLVFCIQAETIAPEDVFGAECQALVLRPRLVLTNRSNDDIELQILSRELHSNHPEIQLAAGQSIQYHWPVSVSSDEPPSLALTFRPRGTQPQRSWSSTVVCSDSSAGSTPFMLRAARGADGDGVEVWSVEVAPMRGALAVCFKQGSHFIALHKAPAARRRTRIYSQGAAAMNAYSYGGSFDLAEMLVRPSNPSGVSAFQFKRNTSERSPVTPPSLSVVPGVEVPFGWLDPFCGNQLRAVDVIVNGKCFHIEDVRQTTVQSVTGTNLVIRVARQGVRTLLVLEVDQGGAAGASGGLDLRVSLSQVGISFIEESPALSELLYVHFEPLEFTYKDTDSDAHELGLRIESAQVDCQLPGRREDFRNTRMSRFGDSIRGRSADMWRPAVILRNIGSKCQPFLSLKLERSATSSGDIVLPKVDLGLDRLEVHIDDEPLEALIHWCHGLNTKGLEQVMHFSDLIAMAGRLITEGYEPPPLPSVVQVESLTISNVKLTLWCRLRLQSLNFLPQYVLTAVRAVSMSNYFTLNGASVSLKRRTFPAHRGSLEDFLAALGAEYGRSVVANIFSILHSSSLLNLPRAPLKIGQGAMTGAMTGVTKGIRHMTENAPFTPPSFVSQRGNDSPTSKRRSTKLAAANMRESQSPFKRMITRAGSMITEVKAVRVRRRQPRLLLPAVGELRPWSSLEASILAHLGRPVCKDIHEVVPLTPPIGSRWCTVLILCTEKLLIMCVDTSVAGDRRGSHASSCASSIDPQDEEGVKFFERAMEGVFYPMQDLDVGGTFPEPSKTSLIFRFPSAMNRDGKIRGLRLSSLKVDPVLCLEDSGPVLELEDFSRTHKLPLPPALISEAVRDALAEGLRSACADSDGDVDWTALRSTLYAERRGLGAEVLPGSAAKDAALVRV